MPDIGWYGLVLVIAAVATAALTVPAKRIALRVGYVAHPGDRTVHTKPIPYGGGAAMFLGFLVAVLGGGGRARSCGRIFQDSPEMTGVVLAAGAMFAVGLIDDVRDMSAPAKMAGQVLAASILYFSGVTMYELKIPLAGFFVLTPGIIPLITAVWVIALTNAVNLIDGLDGLAAGVVAIGGGALALYGIRLMGLGLLPSDNIGPLVAVVACGICLGFLPFNFNPARIFMGDAGAHFLGLLMAASTMVIGGRVPTAVPISGVTYFFFAPLFIPILILGVPLVDMAFAFVRRTARGTGLRHPRQGAHPPPPAAPRPRPPPQRRHPVGLDRHPVQLPPLPALRAPGQCLHPDRGGRPRGGPLHLLPPRACGGATGRTRTMGRDQGIPPAPRGGRSGSARWSGSPRDRLDAIWAGMR